MAGGGKDVAAREGLEGWGGVGWGGRAGFDRWVSNVMVDSFRRKLKGLTLVPRMSVF